MKNPFLTVLILCIVFAASSAAAKDRDLNDKNVIVGIDNINIQTIQYQHHILVSKETIYLTREDLERARIICHGRQIVISGMEVFCPAVRNRTSEIISLVEKIESLHEKGLSNLIRIQDALEIVVFVENWYKYNVPLKQF
jgi:hypothetical protein